MNYTNLDKKSSRIGRVILLLNILIISSCATSRVIKESRDGSFQVIIRGEKSAMKLINKKCPSGHKIVEKGERPSIMFQGTQAYEEFWEIKCDQVKVSKK